MFVGESEREREREESDVDDSDDLKWKQIKTIEIKNRNK